MRKSSAGWMLSVVASLVVGLPAVARANHVAGATYSGKVSGGGTVSFTVSSDGTKVMKFTARDIRGNTCTFTKVTYSPMTISNHAFSNSDVSGSFPGSGTASGSIHVVQLGIPGVTPTCDTGSHSWSAKVIVPQTLTVQRKGSGSGKVTSKPSGINCGGDCKEDYDQGTKVTLRAKPGSNSQFVKWSGACKGDGSCKVTMSSDKSVKATFKAVQTLTVDLEGSGDGSVTSHPAGIDCPGDCKQVYDKGTDVTLAASPEGGSEFAGWKGACSGTGDCNVTMDKNRDVRAEFETIPEPEPTPSPSPMPTPSSSASPSPSPSPSVSPTPTPTPTPTATPGPDMGYGGLWNGTTEDGDPVSFTVNSSNQITQYALGYDTGSCSGTVERVFSTGGVQIQENHSFSDDYMPPSGPDSYWDGFFQSSTVSSGTMLVSGGGSCGAVAFFWDATKQPGAHRTMLLRRLLK